MDLPFLHRKHGDSGEALPMSAMRARLPGAFVAPPAPKLKALGGGQSPGVSVQWGRGEEKQKVCTHPPPSPGSQKVATPGNATASGSLRTGAVAEGPGRS